MTDDNLPRLHHTERTGPVARLRGELARLDGPLSVSNCLVPVKAYDVGDSEFDPNPRASDLGYLDITLDTEFSNGEFVMFDYTGQIRADPDDVINNLESWA